MAKRRQAWILRTEWLLWAAGTLGLLVCLLAFSRIVFARRLASQVVSQVKPDTASSSTQEVSSPQFKISGFGARGPAVVGRVEIPSIGMSTPLLAGDDSMSLTEGAGHIPGTALPGGLGTVGIAGHRDTHFRLLRKAAAGMDVKLIDGSGTYHYRVTSTEIVTPEQVSVLDIVAQPGLALITCYPFSYVGRAPKRFVVHAALVSAAPDETPLKLR